jgi:hypothetical protein
MLKITLIYRHSQAKNGVSGMNQANSGLFKKSGSKLTLKMNF